MLNYIRDIRYEMKKEENKMTSLLSIGAFWKEQRVIKWIKFNSYQGEKI